MDGYTRQTLKRLPLAQAVLKLYAYCFETGMLDSVYRRFKGRGYEDDLKFKTLMDLMADALMRFHGSANRSFNHAQENGALPVTRQAVYGKIGRLAIEVSCALVLEGTARLAELLPDSPLFEPPAGLDGTRIVVIDGKKLKYLAKRLKVAWGKAGAVLGGKVLAAWDPVSGLALALSAHPDGESNDVPLVDDLLSQLRGALAGPVLWIADRQFCNFTVLPALLRRGEHFLVRYAKTTKFCPDRARPARRGQDAQGRPYTEQWGWLGAASNRQRIYVRRITVRRPGRADFSVVTDLLDGDVCRAVAGLELYRRRAGIEHVFQQLTEVFNLRHLIGSTPQASIFQASFCVLIFNLMQVMRAYVAEAQELDMQEVSLENLFYDTSEDLVALARTVEMGAVVSALPQQTGVGEMRRDLRRLLAHARHTWWKKAPPKKNPSRPKARGTSGQHTSMHRLLEAARRRAQRKRRSRTSRRARHAVGRNRLRRRC